MDWVGAFFSDYGEVHVEVEVGGSLALVTLTQAHQARAVQQALNRLTLKRGFGVLRVRFCGLVEWPGTNRVRDSSSSVGTVSGSVACTPNFVESPSSPRRVLAVSATASLDPSVSDCGDVLSGLSNSATVDVVAPLDLAVMQPPTRPGKGRGEGQRKFVCSLAASSTAPEGPEESEDPLGGGAFYDDAEFLQNLEGLRDDVYVCQSKKARRRFLAHVRPLLQSLEGKPLSPEAEAVLAEIHLCVDVV